jgi:hypothetical protein
MQFTRNSQEPSVSTFYVPHLYYNSFFAANMKWHGQEGNIPDLPLVIVTLVNLNLQMDLELQCYLIPNFFNIMPYTGIYTSHTNYWQSVWAKLKQQAGN